MNTKVKNLAVAAIIAAAYAALTYLCAFLGLAYGGVQFRISEMLTVLPIFSAASVPGLTVGCFAANIISTVSPLDMVFGTAATLIAAVLTRAFRGIKIKGYPFLSMLMPAVVNAVIVGAEIAIFTTEDSFLPAFLMNALSVFAGQAAVIFTGGTAIYYFIEKNAPVKRLVSGQSGENI